jgi:hypothetical protein
MSTESCRQLLIGSLILLCPLSCAKPHASEADKDRQIEQFSATSESQSKQLNQLHDEVAAAKAQSATQPGSTIQRIQTPDALDPLQAIVPEVHFDKIRLGDVIDYLRDVTCNSHYVNWQAMEGVGVHPDTLITLTAKDVKYGTLLQLLLERAGGSAPLDFRVGDGAIIISTKSDLTKGLPRVKH